MTSTRSAAADLPLPSLRPASVPELEGTRLRLHIQRRVYGGGSGRPERGTSWLHLSPGDEADDHAALVALPLAQAEALSEACAAFNRIMDAHEQRAVSPASRAA